MHVLHMSLQIRPVAKLLFALVVRAAVQSVVAFRVLVLLGEVSELLLAAGTREYGVANL
jgi:hypothetical protein